LDVEIAEIRADIAAREQELREVRKICDELDATRERLRWLFDENPQAPSETAHSDEGSTVGTSVPAHQKARPRRATSDATLIRGAAQRVLQRAGRPLNRASIRDELIRDGVVLKSKNPLKRIGKVMWQAEEFRHVADGYWFSDVPLPVS
jgi:chromatin segregation and condensation protein Rec8/ScpA/Scc1 (kleisin family)